MTQDRWSLAAAMPVWGADALVLGRGANQVGETASVHSTGDGEPSLPEMLADPIVQILMARDDVTTDEVRDLMDAMRDKLAAEQAEDHQPDRSQPRGRQPPEQDLGEGAAETRRGDVMSKNGCQCADRTRPVEAELTAAASISAVSHNHRMLPGVLRYRGLETEAVIAARLVKVESLIATLQSVLDDLDASTEVRVTPNIGAEPQANNCQDDASGPDARRIARRYAQFVEGMLETALSKIHAGAESVGGHPIWPSEQRFDAHIGGAQRDTNDKSGFREERRA